MSLGNIARFIQNNKFAFLLVFSPQRSLHTIINLNYKKIKSYSEFLLHLLPFFFVIFSSSSSSSAIHIQQERWVHFERYPCPALSSLLLLWRIVLIDVALDMEEVRHPSDLVREVMKRILPPQVVNVLDRSSYLAQRCKCGHSYRAGLNFLRRLLCLSRVLGIGLRPSPTITTAVALRGAGCCFLVHDGDINVQRVICPQVEM